MMTLAERHIYNKGHKYFDTLDQMAFKSKNLYNASLYAVRQHFFENDEYLPYAKLQKAFQDQNQADYRALPSKVAQWTMKMVDQNFKSFFNSLRQYKITPKSFKGTPRIPKYLDKAKGRYLLTFTNQAVSRKELIKRGVIRLSGCDAIEIPTKVSYDALQQVRVVAENERYVVEVLYSVPDTPLKEDNGYYAAIDLGVNNLMTVVTNKIGDIPFVVSGKRLKSFNQFYNKERARFQSIAETRNGRKTTRKVRKLTNKRNNKVNDYLHKASTYVVNQLVSIGVSMLCIGHNKEWKQDTNIGKCNNQNFISIPHSTLISMLSYKCKLRGIDVVEHEESHTSKCSFLDMEDICHHDKYVGRRKYRGLFISSNGRAINADVNGAYNILRKCRPNAFNARELEGVVVHPLVIKTTNGFSDFH